MGSSLEATQKKSQSRHKILAVDDEENFLFLISRTLIKEGYTLRTAPDGHEALRCLAAERFDLALIDLRMAPLDGLSLLGAIREQYPDLRVIVITAYPTPQSERLSLQRGAYRYLTKPLEIQELKEAIRAALSNLDNPSAEE